MVPKEAARTLVGRRGCEVWGLAHVRQLKLASSEEELAWAPVKSSKTAVQSVECESMSVATISPST